MTNKFDGNLWKWLLTNVMGKLTPSTEEASEGQVLTVGDEGEMEWSDPSTGRDVPDASGASDGDVLTVDNEGGYGWEALPVMREVPVASEASDGDVLTADGSGGYAWEAPAGGGGSALKFYRFQFPSGLSANGTCFIPHTSAWWQEGGKIALLFWRQHSGSTTKTTQPMVLIKEDGADSAQQLLWATDTEGTFTRWGYFNFGSNLANSTISWGTRVPSTSEEIILCWLAKPADVVDGGAMTTS